MNKEDDRRNAAAVLARGVPRAAQGPTLGGVVTEEVRVTVEFLPAEYDRLGEFLMRAKKESGLRSKVAAGHLIRVLLDLAQKDEDVARRLFERLLTEGPTRHRS